MLHLDISSDCSIHIQNYCEFLVWLGAYGKYMDVNFAYYHFQYRMPTTSKNDSIFLQW